MDESTVAVASTFFQIGSAVGFGVFLFGIVPTLFLMRFLNKRR